MRPALHRPTHAGLQKMGIPSDALMPSRDLGSVPEGSLWEVIAMSDPMYRTETPTVAATAPVSSCWTRPWSRSGS